MTSWSDAAAEALASAPSDTVVLDTLELIHPIFVDDQGGPTAIRIVRNHPDTRTWLTLAPAEVQPVLDGLDEEARKRTGLVARLEDSAPIDAGAYVAWTALSFSLDLPEIDADRLPDIAVRMDNVGREVMERLQDAVASPYLVELRYRPYLSTDISGPQMVPPLKMEFTEAEADMLQLRGRARISDLARRAFPSELYTARDFPGLAR